MADLKERYGESDGTPIAAVEFDPPDGGFFVAYLDGEPLACAAWRSHQKSEDIGEVKRVFVAEKSRGLGLARQIMSAIEEDARAHGRQRLILETGIGQPEAIALYQALGYQRIPDFGHYRDESGVRSFGKDL
ncbi:MAG TPA: GNAT family N-acetyltransferase [Micromonosporaceae bacterium]|nr:GNAT family N-acetyltransferase [Micromonosporaceae bacterium]